MKIAIVAPGGFDPTGVRRTIPVFNDIVAALAKRHDVHVITLYQQRETFTFPLLGATVHSVGNPSGPLAGPRTVTNAIRAILNEHALGSFTAIHGLWAGDPGLAAVIAARRLGISSVVSLLGGELSAIPEIGYGAQLHLRNRLRVAVTLRLAVCVIANSQTMGERLRRLRPDARVIYNGPRLERFNPASEAMPGPPWRLLHVGSLNRVKDQRTLIRAFSEVLLREPWAHLDMVGEDTLDGEIQAYASGLGVASRVSFHGFRPAYDVAEMMRSSHLLIHSSLHEAGEAVFSEAAACGLPVVGTRVGMVADFAGDLCVGAPVRDYEALAEAAVGLLRNREQREDLRVRLIRWAAENDSERTAERWEGLYRCREDRSRVGTAANGELRRTAVCGRVESARNDSN